MGKGVPPSQPGVPAVGPTRSPPCAQGSDCSSPRIHTGTSPMGAQSCPMCSVQSGSLRRRPLAGIQPNTMTQ